jgi:hypothetical protein
VFGREVVQAAISEVVDTLRSWDASRHTVVNQIPSALSDLLLVAGTSRLEDVTEQQVRALAERYSRGARRSGLIKISRVLAHRGIIAHPLHNTDPQRGPRPDTLATVPASWLAWAQRWRGLSTLEPGTLRQMFSVILIAGRWAAEKHPEALIDSLRGFFCDLIDWEWIKPRFDPRKAAGLTLNSEDLNEYGPPVANQQGQRSRHRRPAALLPDRDGPRPGRRVAVRRMPHRRDPPTRHRLHRA